MAMVVKNNMSAVNTLNTLNKNQSLLGKSLQKVSSGMKINSAQDDASGYAISERMRVMIRSLDQANQNTQNGSSLMKVAEGAVSNTVEILKTLKEKAINAATDTNTEEDRAIIQKEIDQLVDQIDDNALITFNGKYLLDGSKSSAGVATYNTWTNQSLAENTNGLTKLTDLYSRSGEALTIESTDQVTVSYVQNGKTYTTTATVGDKTFSDVFKLAEDLDLSSKTFATSANEALRKVGGMLSTGNADVDAIKDTITYLKSALGIKNDLGVDVATLTTTPSLLSIKAGTGVANTDGTVSTVTLANDVITDSTTAVAAGYPGIPTGITSDTGIVSAYDGDIYKQLKSAVDSFNNILNEVGAYAPDSNDPLGTSGTGVGIAFYLGEALRTEGVAWTGTASDLADLKPKIEELGGDVLSYYTQYQDAVSRKDKAEEVMNAALKNYNNNLLELDSLIRLQAYASAQSTYLSTVTSYAESVSNIMANDSADVTYKLPAGIANNDDAITYNPTTDKGDAGIAKIDAITQALEAKLKDLLNSASLPKPKTLTDEVTKVINTAASGFSKTPAGGSAVVVDNAAGNLISGVNGAATAVVDAAADITDTDKKVLEMAYSDALAAYTGPTLLTGTNVGLDPSGKIVTTLDGTVGLTFMAANSGADGQISGFTISISDSDGNVRKSVNTSLNAWSTSVYGKNASEKDNSLAFQIGASANQTITVDMADMRAEALGLKGKDGKVVDVSTKENANAAISVFENALQKALDVQTTIGAIEARLEYTSSNLTTSTENVQAAESTIRDADMAKEMTNYTKNNVLLQAAQSMLAQANQNSSAVLSLLQ